MLRIRVSAFAVVMFMACTSGCTKARRGVFACVRFTIPRAQEDLMRA